MTKTKTQTKKQLIEEVEKLKEFIQSLQADAPQDPTQQSKTRPPTRQGSPTDENEDPWAPAQSPRSVPAGTPLVTSAGADRRAYRRMEPREDDAFNNNDYYNGDDDDGGQDDEETLHRHTYGQPGPEDNNDEETCSDDKGAATDDDGDMQSDRRSTKKRKTAKRNFPHIELDLDNGTNPHLRYNVDGLIAKPPGEPGRVSRGKKQGFCLRRAMGYPPELPDGHPSRKNDRWKRKNQAYNALHEYARRIINKWFEPGVPYFRQEPKRRVKAEKAWLAQFPKFPSIYEKNWPMDAIFSTIMQNNKKRLKSGKLKKNSLEEDEDNDHEGEDANPFAIRLPDGKVLGGTTEDADSTTQTPLLSTTKSSRSHLPSSSRTAAADSSRSSSNRQGPTMSNAPRPSSSARDHHAPTHSPSSGSSPLVSRSRVSNAAPQLGFALAEDPSPKRKKGSAPQPKQLPAPASRKGKEVDRTNGMDVDDEEPPIRPPSRPKPRRKEKVAEPSQVAASRPNARKRARVIDSEDEEQNA